MQKDFHFYVTYALARKAGIKPQVAKKIAWANQFTDELTKADLYEVQTQCKKLGNWGDRQIQLSVLIPFHFIPGGTPKSKWPWVTTENNKRAQGLVEAALKSQSTMSTGIALHGLQDTFSHQGFSGWEEENNSCYPWYYLESGLPNVGHTEMLVVPDMVDREWTDPRTNKLIHNQQRAIRAAEETFKVLANYCGLANQKTAWISLRPRLEAIFKNHNYDKRKLKLLALSGNPKFRYNKITASMEKRWKTDFVQSATQHLAEAIRLFSDLS